MRQVYTKEMQFMLFLLPLISRTYKIYCQAGQNTLKQLTGSLYELRHIVNRRSMAVRIQFWTREILVSD